MSSTKWLNYGRVSAIKGQWGQWRADKYELYTHIVLFMPDWRPNYALGKHLLVVTNSSEYRIYNPQRLTFSFNLLLSHIKTSINVWGEQFESYSIEEAYRGK